jgi:hypothetical protein
MKDEKLKLRDLHDAHTLGCSPLVINTKAEGSTRLTYTGLCGNVLVSEVVVYLNQNKNGEI